MVLQLPQRLRLLHQCERLLGPRLGFGLGLLGPKDQDSGYACLGQEVRGSGRSTARVRVTVMVRVWVRLL